MHLREWPRQRAAYKKARREIFRQANMEVAPCEVCKGMCSLKARTTHPCPSLAAQVWCARTCPGLRRPRELGGRLERGLTSATRSQQEARR
jgi:hypothetical protein